MSRVRNADQFLMEFRRHREVYEQHYVRRLERVRQKFTGVSNPDPVLADMLKEAEDGLLEAHVRESMINALLGALNWRMDMAIQDEYANLLPEVPLKSRDSGNTRRLDYLGLERHTDRPLLIVESKRPSSKLPESSAPLATDQIPPGNSLTTALERVVAAVIARGLAGQPISREWDGWLKTLQDYVRRVQHQSGHTPCRVVITNGNWLILFFDPADAFGDDKPCDPAKIFVYENRDAIEKRYTEVFRFLEHQSVLNEPPPLTLGELPFHVSPKAITFAMHGLRLMYIEEPGFFEASPVIKVMPLVFLRTCYGAWLCVESRHEERLPHVADKLSAHLACIRKCSKSLLEGINRAFHAQLPLSSLSKHYANEDGFHTLPDIVACNSRTTSGAREFIMVTGENTHYLRPEPTVPNCPYHSWANCRADGVAANPGPLEIRTINPKSFFTSEEYHHCAHREVAAAKASQITASNRDRCGSRSRQDGQAFCEIWRFEEHLCCRTCAFEEVCTKAQAFVLPCQHPEGNE